MKKKDKLDIIYEDKDIIAVNKPSGLLTVSTEKEKENTLYYKVSTYEKKKNKNNKIFIVHRLDRFTSGIVIFAKNMKTKAKLQNNWDKIVLKREYIAIVEGIPEKSEVTLKSYLYEDKNYVVHSTNNPKKGDLAITKYRVVCSNSKNALLSIEIKTGKKNQIRVQLKDINCPIVGDKKYGSNTDPIKRLALHANKLIIAYPSKNDKLILETDIPLSFINYINKKILWFHSIYFLLNISTI